MSNQKVDSKVMRAFRRAHKAGLVESPTPAAPQYNLQRTVISQAVGWVCANWSWLNRA